MNSVGELNRRQVRHCHLLTGERQEPTGGGKRRRLQPRRTHRRADYRHPAHRHGHRRTDVLPQKDQPSQVGIGSRPVYSRSQFSTR